MNNVLLKFSGGSTNTAAALTTLRTDVFTSGRGDRSNSPNIAVVVTDGASNDPAATLREAALARAQGITLLAVGVGPWVDPLELSAIASQPTDRNVFYSTQFSSLDSITDSLVQAMCNS